MEFFRKRIDRYLPGGLFFIALLSGFYYFVLSPEALTGPGAFGEAERLVQQAERARTHQQYDRAKKRLGEAQAVLDRVSPEEIKEENWGYLEPKIHDLRARLIWEEALKKNPRDLDEVAKRVEEEFQEAVRKGVSPGRTRTFRVGMADKLWQKGFQQSSVMVLDQLSDALKGDYEIVKTLLRRYLQSGQEITKGIIAKGQASLRMAQREKEQNRVAELRLLLSRLRAARKEPEEALSLLQGVVSNLDDRDGIDEILRLELLLESGRLHLDVGDLDRAEEILKRARNLADGFGGDQAKRLEDRARYYLARLGLARGEHEGPLSVLKELSGSARDATLRFAAAFLRAEKKRERIRERMNNSDGASRDWRTEYLSEFADAFQGASRSAMRNNPHVDNWEKAVTYFRNGLMLGEDLALLEQVARGGRFLKELYPDRPGFRVLEGRAYRKMADLLNRRLRKERWKESEGRNKQMEEQSTRKTMKRYYGQAADLLYDAAKDMDDENDEYMPALKEAARSAFRADIFRQTLDVLSFDSELVRDPRMKVLQGKARAGLGKVGDALDAYSYLQKHHSTVKLDPENHFALLKAKLLRDEGRLQEAVSTVEWLFREFDRNSVAEPGTELWNHAVKLMVQLRIKQASNADQEEGRNRMLDRADNFLMKELHSAQNDEANNAPFLVELYELKSKIERMRKNYEKAAGALSRALDVSSNVVEETGRRIRDLPSYENRVEDMEFEYAGMLKLAGKFPEAIQAYRNLLGRDTDPYTKFYTSVELANLYLRTGKLRKARQSHLRAKNILNDELEGSDGEYEYENNLVTRLGSRIMRRVSGNGGE